MHDSLGRNQRVRHLLNCRRLALEDQDLQAVIVIQMNMKRGKNQMKMVVLHRGKAIRKQAHVMIVNQRQRPHHRAIGLLRGLFDKHVPNQVPEGFGAIVVASLLNVIVEFGEQIGINRYADAAEVAHSIRA